MARSKKSHFGAQYGNGLGKGAGERSLGPSTGAKEGRSSQKSWQSPYNNRRGKGNDGGDTRTQRNTMKSYIRKGR